MKDENPLPLTQHRELQTISIRDFSIGHNSFTDQSAPEVDSTYIGIKQVSITQSIIF
jgi:hypothetical protein